MEYYNPQNNSSKVYAAATTVVLMGLMALAASFINIVVEIRDPEIEAIEIEYVEELAQLPETLPTPRVDDARVQSVESSHDAHEEVAMENTSNQTSGRAEKTQTMDPRAMFNPTSGITPDEELTSGNRLAPDGDGEERKGTGTGDNVRGLVEFDGGISADDVLPGHLDLPQGNNSVGRVTVKIEVDNLGRVVRAQVQQQGTTTSDSQLRENARRAALNTRFKADSSSLKPRSGVIRYVFKVN